MQLNNISNITSLHSHKVFWLAKIENDRAGGVTEVEEHLHSNHEALSSNLCTTKKTMDLNSLLLGVDI
jgi:hypothetical protein